MIIRSKAPLRVSFAGGGTDVAPFKDEEGGCVLSTTINQYVYGTLHYAQTGQVRIHSLDYDLTTKYIARQNFRRNGKLSLVKATLQRLHEGEVGGEIFIHADSPPGSGLGSSSTMVVTLIGLFRELLKKPLSNYDIAEMAYLIERVDLGMRGGMQDQYAAAFGGVNFIEFYKDKVIVNPLRIDPTTLNELQYNLVFCTIGRTRVSEEIIQQQVSNYVRNEVDAVEAMHVQKGIAIDMKNCLLTGKLDKFAELLEFAWVTKKKMAAGITTAQIDEMYTAAKKAGAIGGKVLGAGGGGYLMFYCRSGRKHIVAHALTRLGGRIVDFGFEGGGLQTWSVNRGAAMMSHERTVATVS